MRCPPSYDRRMDELDEALDWLGEAGRDIAQWAAVMPSDADGRPVDWGWVRGLDLRSGLGVGLDCQPLEDEGWPLHGPVTDAQDVHDALKADYAVRDRVEAILAQCPTAFMGDFDRFIDSYRLPRALAYANRRLNDEIALLVELGVRHGAWRASMRRQGRVFAVVLSPMHGASAGNPDQRTLGAEGFDASPQVRLDDIQDRSAAIAEARAERRKAARAAKRSSDALMARANLSGATGPGADPLASGNGGVGPAKAMGEPKGQSRSDWRDAYLPGRDIDTVMGIDIETTGTNPMRDYILNVGFEYMNMRSPRPEAAGRTHAYADRRYEAGDAYGQAHLDFGVPRINASLGNETILKLTGIDVRSRGEDQCRPFDEWPQAQRGLLTRLVRQPYVAHNATFEHGFFMLNVAGYAEAYRAGQVTIVDTLPMSRRWDPGSVATPEHPYGDNTLDSYAKRQGALSPDQSERHLGLEDAHIMLVAMKHHLQSLRAAGLGPWGADGKSGEGGKRLGRGYGR